MRPARRLRVAGLPQGRLPELVCASMVSVIGAALEAHVRQARELGWAQPRQLPRSEPGVGGPRPPLVVRRPAAGQRALLPRHARSPGTCPCAQRVR